MTGLWEWIRAWLEEPGVMNGVKALLFVSVGFVAARIVSRSVRRGLATRLDAQQLMVTRRVTFYGIWGLSCAAALRQVGLDLSVFLGAAGVATVAMGFASQTSASNVISGLFLLGERPFAVGDTIRTATVTGEVLSVDLLSVKLRTLDNLFVRVPNELLIKSEITNLSRFPIRRIDINLRIAHGEDLARVRALLLGVAAANPRCLVNPAPVVATEDFAESAVVLRFSAWTRREIFLDIKSELQTDIQHTFAREGVGLPTARRALEGNDRGPALRVRIESAGGDPRAETDEDLPQDEERV